jgi:ADP-heptose:LPS heptosyltransferase
MWPFRKLEWIDIVLKQAQKEKYRNFLIAWIKGLGDIPLRLCGFSHYIKSHIPEVQISYITRPGLEEALSLMEDVPQVIVVPSWRRGDSKQGLPTLQAIEEYLEEIGRRQEFEVLIPQVNRGRWRRNQIGRYVPRLQWKEEYDNYGRQLRQKTRGARVVAIHLEAGTQKFYRVPVTKDWDRKNWLEVLREILVIPDTVIFLLGAEKTGITLESDRIVDLRGDTSVIQALSLILASDLFLAPDSGLLNLVYYLGTEKPLKVISLWGQIAGCLQQAVPSPNPRLQHFPIIGKDHWVNNIIPEAVMAQVRQVLVGVR